MTRDAGVDTGECIEPLGADGFAAPGARSVCALVEARQGSSGHLVVGPSFFEHLPDGVSVLLDGPWVREEHLVFALESLGLFTGVIVLLAEPFGEIW